MLTPACLCSFDFYFRVVLLLSGLFVFAFEDFKLNSVALTTAGSLDRLPSIVARFEVERVGSGTPCGQNGNCKNVSLIICYLNNLKYFESQIICLVFTLGQKTLLYGFRDV